MKKDIIYVNAICKSEENKLLGHDRIMRIVDSDSLDEGLRVLREAEFGGDTVIGSASEFEKLISHEKKSLFAFLRENLGKCPFLSFVTAENDFHNAEAVLRSKRLGLPLEQLLTDEGEIPVECLTTAVDNGDYTSLPDYLADTMKVADGLFKDGLATGFTVNTVFTKGLAETKLKFSACHKTLKKCQVFDTDAKNIAICFRSENVDVAKNSYLTGGKLTEDDLAVLITKDVKKIKGRFSGTEYYGLIEKCIACVNDGLPLVDFESEVNGYTLKAFKDNRFTGIDGIEPVILYTEYKLNEIYNVRTAMVGLATNMDKSEIKKRLRENYAG